MNKLLMFIKNAFANGKSVLLREYSSEMEYEDAILFKNLVNHLCVKNTQNTLLFSVFEFIYGVFYLFSAFLS